ncbi:hypothetical protein PM082_006699 [Marasmius tenuissimus]|nr:hypothetical protein PM082_006699 [Marasmius tenuissimus]
MPDILPENELAYTNDFWKEKIGEGSQKLSITRRFHLLFSLLVYLDVPLGQFLLFIFTSSIKAIEGRANRFLKTTPNATNPNAQFWPGTLFRLWSKGRKSREALDENVVMPRVEKIVLKESNRLMKDSDLRVDKKKLTLETIRRLLQPAQLIKKYQDKAPRFWYILHAFTTARNEYRRKRKAHAVALGVSAGNDSSSDSGEETDGSDNRSETSSVTSETSQILEGDTEEVEMVPKPPGFMRNPYLAIVLVISMLQFVRNSRTNLLPLLLGLFFRIEGTGSRVMAMLSNVGICVSTQTVERLKEVISKDAVAFAIALMRDFPRLVAIFFDNINLFLRKHQQRVTNQNEMLNITNVAAVGLDDSGIDVAEAKNLKAYLELRGQRANAKPSDIFPTNDDHVHLSASFIQLILEIMIMHSPGASKWERRAEYRRKVQEMIPHDRPLPVQKSDARPMGVFDVNEGSKKGVVKVMKEIQERSTVSQEQWEAETRIVGGDWLTANLFRLARKDRFEDLTVMDRVENVAELSQLFHFALNASHGMMRAHFGNAISDPTSLAKHKGLLGRTWDAAKPNYTGAKALVRHSLIARILHIVMVKKSIRRWSKLAEWEPESFEDLHDLAKVICEDFASTKAAEKSKELKNDWAAHDRYFIRDALMFLTFEQAVSYADAGRVLSVLKYWTFFFRGCGQHNYGRECAEILIKWKYELPPALRAALERSWFYNRWGLPGRWIAMDLYIEQLNYWIKRVYLAFGNGVTVQYIISKGSACVEAFRDISRRISRFFGNRDRLRRSKEMKFMKDIEALVQDMEKIGLHKPEFEATPHFVAAPPSKRKNAKKSNTPITSAIFDILVAGASVWHSGKFKEFIKSTTYDPAVNGFSAAGETTADPDEERLNTDTPFDDTEENPIEIEAYEDTHGDDLDGKGYGGVGGGGRYDTGDPI